MDGEGRATSGSLRLRILQKYDGLSRSERRVADVVLLRGEKLLDDTISSLAHDSGVSEPTVVRFCNSIGFRGIKELKRAAVPVPQATSSEERIPLADVDSEEKLVSFVLDQMHDVLRETHMTLDRGRLAKAIGLLEGTRFVKVAGLGGSAVVARHAQHYLRRIGIQCTSFSVYEPQDIVVERYDPGDVVLAISYSGDNPLVVDIVADAKRKGAGIICITSWGESRLERLADVSLQTPFGGQGVMNGHHALERTAQIAIVNVLFAGLYLRKQQIGG